MIPTPPQSLPSLQALDLTALARAPERWTPTCPAAGGVSAQPSPAGFASPMGFWINEPTAELSPPDRRFALVFDAPLATHHTSVDLATRPFSVGRETLTARLKAPAEGDGELLLTLNRDLARVSTTPATWSVYAEPVLLAVTQAWRFQAIEAQLDRLSEPARAALSLASRFARWKRGYRADIRFHRTVLANLLLDLPHFEGPLIDPRAFCASDASARCYQSLAKQLQLEPWCDRIDERIEALSHAYETLTERDRDARSFAWQVALESLIVLLLLAELAVTFQQYLTAPE